MALSKYHQEYHYVVDPLDLVLISDPAHPLYDELVHRKPAEDMIKNIMYRGVIKPVIVTIEDGRMLVVDGRQRVMAARIASDRLEQQGLVRLRIKCVRRRGDAHDMLVTMISANEHRHDDDPLIRAKKAARLVSLRASEDEVANCFGVTVQTIRNWLTLLELAPVVQDAVSQGVIGATAATKLAPLSHADQTEHLQAMLSKTERMTVDRVAHRTRNLTGQKRGPLVPKRQLQRLYKHKRLPQVLGEEARGILALLLGEHDYILGTNPELASLLDEVRFGKRQARRRARQDDSQSTVLAHRSPSHEDHDDDTREWPIVRPRHDPGEAEKRRSPSDELDHEPIARG